MMEISQSSGHTSPNAVSPVSPQTNASGHGSQTPGASGAAPIKRRAPIACRRCRRMRSKCLHDKHPPCRPCLEAGVPEECAFPSRGDPDEDRQFRHPRQRTDRRPKSEAPRVKRESIASPGPQDALTNAKPPKWENEWSLLPEVDIIKEGVVAFTLHYFQLGFIPKERFPLQIEQYPASVSVFLLLSILSISARFNKKIQARYGNSQRAVEWFMKSAERLAINELYQQPTLERCQAFLLLSIAQQGCGMSNSSYINMGVATRMAALMRLHREETYERITSSSSSEEIIRAESARRTFWVLHSQDNLHSGPYKPFSLAPSDITALLPCDEEEFKNAVVPQSRAALEGTPPAIQNPQLTSLRPRSLFATLIQTHHLWGIIARRAVANEKSSRPGSGESDYSRMANSLRRFEDHLFGDHRFGIKSLKGHRQDNEDLAFLGCTTGLRLCNIVLRKAYMDEMIHATRSNPRDQTVRMYRKMGEELVENVRMLYEQVDAQYTDDRPSEERVGSQMATFCVYSCGLLAAYMHKFPHLDPHRHPEEVRVEGKRMYERTITFLEESQTIWTLASSWLVGLKKWFDDPNTNRISFESGTMTDGQDPQPHALLHPPTSTSAWQNKMAATLYRTRTTPPQPMDRRHNPMAEPEPTTLPPLQPASMSANHQDSLSLPPISPYSHPQQPPPPPYHISQQPQQPMGPSNQHEGFYALYQAAHHQAPPQQPLPDVYSNTYMADYQAMPIPDDGFGFNLQQMLDPSWSAPNAPAALYNYPPPDVQQYPQNHEGSLPWGYKPTKE
ncbi:putative Zn(2)-C6 fungal-type domain-containing protein [Seiridium cardinale]|uniref:Zn(2)-C6 fungal-type domain-containing protein n=1 Tax=Seiridium cardinale TaxID=138064 RepID=A0ABR2XU84_9PEZI